MTTLRAACAALLLAAPLGAGAAMYRWVDDRGVTTYGNVPPKGRAATLVVDDRRVSTVPAPPPAQAARERQLLTDMRIAALERRIEALENAPPPTVPVPAPSQAFFLPPPVTFGFTGFPVFVGGDWRGVHRFPGHSRPWRPGFPVHGGPAFVHRPIHGGGVRGGVRVGVRAGDRGGPAGR